MSRVSIKRAAAVAVLCTVFAASVLAASDDTTSLQSGARRLATTIRLGMSIASIGAYAPTVADCRLLAQRLVNLLEGTSGEHYVASNDSSEPSGMIPGIAWVSARCESHGFASETRTRALAASRNASVYLGMALDATLAALNARGLERATTSMLAAYAFLGAACETACAQSASPLVPALATLVSLLEIESETVD